MIGALILKHKVRAAFETMNRKDLENSLRNYAENAVFVYPGDIEPSGTHTGREAIRAWLTRFFAQFQTIRFTVRQVAVTNPFDLTGTNLAAAHWEVYLTNRDGRASILNGVSLITTRLGRAVHVQDFIFDTGDKFRLAWTDGRPGRKT